MAAKSKNAKTRQPEKLDTYEPPADMTAKIADDLVSLALPIDELHPDPANARTHTDANIETLKTSLSQFGQRKPIVVQRDGLLIRAGNGLWHAAKALGWSHIAAVVVDEGSTDATAFAIMDNRSAETSEWNDEVLAQQLLSLQEDNYNLEFTGFSEPEIDVLCKEIEEIAKGTKLNRIDVSKPPPQMAWVLVGIQIVRYGEIAEQIEKLTEVDGVIVKTTVNDGD